MKLKRLSKRRRVEGKTDYKRRLLLLKGNTPRLVVRKSNRYIQLQIVESDHAQDKVIASFTTKHLLEHGWPKEKAGSLKSISASYLAGFALGKKAAGIKEGFILDIGLTPSTKGSRVYAAVKGFADAGARISFSDAVIPEKEKIEKPDFFKKVKGELEKIQ
jgi:large subunit ribosomal protein L18